MISKSYKSSETKCQYFPVTDNGEAVEESRATTQAISYIPYGEVFVEQQSGGWSSPYLFNAKELDSETGLYYYGARYLDPSDAMWLSVDPLWEKYVGMTPYNYCGGNPVVMVDPDGREKKIAVSGNFKRAANHFPRNIGVIHLWAHGVEEMKTKKCSGIQIEKGDCKYLIETSKDLDKYLQENSSIYKENKTNDKTSILVMHSCKTGQKGSIAQQSSKDLNLLVIAPSEDLGVETLIYQDGKKVSTETKIQNGGVWNIYYKGELMESFNGSTKPLFDNPKKTIEKYEKMWQERQKQNNKGNE